ncbi:hypothetical protein LXL04_012830 [Taraxacum kok-saghyz]
MQLSNSLDVLTFRFESLLEIFCLTYKVKLLNLVAHVDRKFLEGLAVYGKGDWVSCKHFKKFGDHKDVNTSAQPCPEIFPPSECAGKRKKETKHQRHNHHKATATH